MADRRRQINSPTQTKTVRYMDRKTKIDRPTDRQTNADPKTEMDQPTNQVADK